MAVIRVKKTRDYTVMSNAHLKNKEMSLKAKGLLSLMLSLPDDWDYSIAGLVTLSKDGKDSVMNALSELENFGYLKRVRLTDAKGRFTGYDYDVLENPYAENPYAENPYAENPNTENPNTENPYAENPNTENPNTENPYAENPNTENPYAENPNTENPNTENPYAENPTQLNTNKSITKKQNTKEINKDIYICEFEEIWKLYPNKKGKVKSLAYYKKAREKGVPFETIKTGVENYAAECQIRCRDVQYIKNGSTWFGNECWNDEYNLTPQQEKTEDAPEWEKAKKNNVFLKLLEEYEQEVQQ